jgi:hypothetical protein
MNRLFVIATSIVVSFVLTGCSAAVVTGEPESDDHASESPGREMRTENPGEPEEGSKGVESLDRPEDDEEGEHTVEHERSEHSEREHEEREESGEYIGAGDKWRATRNGLELHLVYAPELGTFFGTVRNTTEQKLCAVRVEIHLSSGVELGPTKPKDLDAGAKTGVMLGVAGKQVDRWTAHPETSKCPGD